MISWKVIPDINFRENVDIEDYAVESSKRIFYRIGDMRILFFYPDFCRVCYNVIFFYGKELIHLELINFPNYQRHYYYYFQKNAIFDFFKDERIFRRISRLLKGLIKWNLEQEF